MSQIVDYKGHLELMKNHLNAHKAVLFVGAGFSRNAEPKYAEIKTRFKTWTEFMEQLGSRLWPEIYVDDKDKFWEKINGNHLLVAQLFQEEFGIETFYNELLQAVPYRDFEPSQIHKDLLSLGWRDIITTNQDLLLEQTLEALHQQFDVVIDDLDIPIKNELRKVYKMHGCMTRPSSVIFTEEQFRTYERLHPLMHVKLKAIFAEYTVAFVGFSLTDPNFKAIYGWVSDVLTRELVPPQYCRIALEVGG